jgi:FtsP/CotA-like multicopper oxidase with cupredoxin domain
MRKASLLYQLSYGREPFAVQQVVTPCLARRHPAPCRASAAPPPPDDIIEMTFAKNNAAADGFNRWTITGVSFSRDVMSPIFHLQKGKRDRPRMRNTSDAIHAVRVHRHSFELTQIMDIPTAAVVKDVVMLNGYRTMDIDFVANNPGRTLFHCHQQLHMDFGFMALFHHA